MRDNLYTIIIFLASMTLFGWIFHFDILTQWNYNFVPMQFNTALCFLVLSLGILYDNKYCMYFIVSMAFFSCLQDFTNYNFGIDELFIEARITEGTNNPGRMAVATGLLFVFCGCSHLIKSFIIKHYLGSFTFLISFIAVLGYVFNLSVLYNLFGKTEMAIHTAICFLTISISDSIPFYKFVYTHSNMMSALETMERKFNERKRK